LGRGMSTKMTIAASAARSIGWLAIALGLALQALSTPAWASTPLLADVTPHTPKKALTLRLANTPVEGGETIHVRLSPAPNIGDGLEIDLVDPVTRKRIPGRISEHGEILPHVVPPHVGRFDVEVTRRGRTLASQQVEVVEPAGRVRMKLSSV